MKKIKKILMICSILLNLFFIIPVLTIWGFIVYTDHHNARYNVEIPEIEGIEPIDVEDEGKVGIRHINIEQFQELLPPHLDYEGLDRTREIWERT
jgi:hypothetical protein